MRPRLPSPAQFGTGALVIAALAVGRVVADITPESDAGSRPFERTGSVGELVELRYADLTVTEVEGSPRFSRSYGDGFLSPGIWLVVTARMAPTLDGDPPYFAEVRGGDGSVISKGNRNLFQCDPANPGITVTCGVAFEVSPDSLPGARLVVAKDSLQDQRYDDEAVIDLGIDEATVTRWKTTTTTLVFPLDRTTETDG